MDGDEQSSESPSEDEINAQLERVAKITLTNEARSRLKNVEIAHKELALKVKVALMQLYQSGQIKRPLSEEELKSILSQIAESKKGFRIIR